MTNSKNNGMKVKSKTKKTMREHLKTIINNKQKRLVVIGLAFLFVLALWVIFFTNEVDIAATVTLSATITLFVNGITTLTEIIFNIESDDGAYKSMVTDFLRRECRFCKTSLVGVYKNREDAHIENLLAECNKEVKFLTTNLQTMAEKKYYDRIVECLDRGLTVELLTMDPKIAESFNLHRVTGEDNDPAARYQDMKKSLNKFIELRGKRLRDEKNGTLIIKTYKIFPTMILFIVDNNCILSFMFQKTYARDAMHIHFDLSKEKCLADIDHDSLITAESFRKHFDDIFNDEDFSEEVNL